MGVEGMTRENVASHLQKYRLYLKRVAGLPANAPLSNDALQHVHQALHGQPGAAGVLKQKACSSDRPYETSATLPGLFNVNPEYSCNLVVPGPAVVSAVTGPDIGVTELQQPQQQGDGVSWGERPKVAARAAVLGFVAHIHKVLQQLHAKGQQTWSSNEAFDAMRGAVQAAQQMVKASNGTLTTLVAAIVAPQRWGPGHSLLTVLIGDSPAYVWRAKPARVEEVSYMPPLHGMHRDPRICPGCLGFAIGDKPDLTNVTFSITRLDEGDLVFLTSDGISDNFDPIMRKQARPARGQSPSSGSKLPAMSTSQRRMLEAPDRGPVTEEFADAVADLPGKMDHACVVAYKVGPKRSRKSGG
eukprot:gene11906-12050_t